MLRQAYQSLAEDLKCTCIVKGVCFCCSEPSPNQGKSQNPKVLILKVLSRIMMMLLNSHIPFQVNMISSKCIKRTVIFVSDCFMKKKYDHL